MGQNDPRAEAHHKRRRAQEIAKRRDEVCDRVTAGKVLHIRARLKGVTCVGTVDGASIITSVLLRSATGEGQ